MRQPRRRTGEGTRGRGDRRPRGGRRPGGEDQEEPPNTTFWLKPGTHRLERDRYAQVIPKKGDHYIGAPGAVLDGRKVNQYAFTGNAADVTIRYLTVQGFVAPQDEGVVNHDSADGWVVEHSTIKDNALAPD